MSKLGHATGQWPQAHHEIYNRMTEKQQNERVAMVQSPASSLIQMLWQTGKWTELKQH